MDLTSSVLSVITPISSSENNYAMWQEMHHADNDTHKVLNKDIETCEFLPWVARLGNLVRSEGVQGTNPQQMDFLQDPQLFLASGIYPYPKGLQNGNWKTDELKTVTVTTIKAPKKKIN